MTAAVLTPRVRTMVICDEATPSATEGSVYLLEGVRVQLVAGEFPCKRDVSLFLLLSCARRGTWAGWVQAVHRASIRTIRYEHFVAAFQQDNEILPITVPVENCIFRMPGEYMFEVWFTVIDGDSAQKGELPLFLLESED